MKIVPDIRKYFRFDNIKGAYNPNNVKRPWLSIIRHTTKQYYQMNFKDKQIRIDNKSIRTRLYTFVQK